MGKTTIEVLAGIPTIVYGVFAMMIIEPFFKAAGAYVGIEINATSALTAGFNVRGMIIPFVSSLSDDIITQVPRALREVNARCTSPCRKPERELRQGAKSHGWELDENIHIFELTPPESLLNGEHQQSLLYSSDLELGEATKQIFEVVERVKPTPGGARQPSEIRLLAQSSLRYRRQILAIKHYFVRYDATDAAARRPDHRIPRQNRAQRGPRVIRLEEVTPNYGAGRRRIRVLVPGPEVSRRLS